MRIIINADDFGQNKEINEAITKCMKTKICTHTTLMVNMKSSIEAVELAKKNDFLNKVGLHLNLTEGKPLTQEIKKHKKFCNLNGQFNGNFHRNILSKFFLSKQEKKAITEEIEAQLKKFLIITNLDRIRLDSHHHVHTNYSIFQLIKPLLKKYNITCIRKSRNLFEKLNFIKKIYKIIYNKQLDLFLLEKNDLFGSIIDVKNAIEKNSLKCESIEIMVHPKIIKGKLKDIGGVEDSLEKEVKEIKNYFQNNCN